MGDNHAENRPICLPSEVDLKLRLGICRILEKKYHPIFGNQSKFLVAGLVNWALCDSPRSEEAKKFLETNNLIEEEASKLHLDARVSAALSVLYTFTLIWLGTTDPEKSAQLVDRATDLNILFLSAKELCPTDDAIHFLAVLDEYANGPLEGPD